MMILGWLSPPAPRAERATANRAGAETQKRSIDDKNESQHTSPQSQRWRPVGGPFGVASSVATVTRVREMGGAPRNPAPRNHFWVWIVKPSRCHCAEWHLTSRVFTEDQTTYRRVPTPLRSTSPFSKRGRWALGSFPHDGLVLMTRLALYKEGVMIVYC